MRLKHLLQATLIALVLATTASTCSSKRLEPGGAYAPAGQQADMQFYAVDAAYDLAYYTIEAVFTFEMNNEVALWKLSPDIKHTLDKIRPQAWAANLEYHKARDAYMKNPVPANLSTLQAVVAKLQQLAVTASAVVPQQSKP